MKDYSESYTVVYEEGSSYGVIEDAGDTTIVAAPGAGKQIYVNELQIQSEAAGALTILIKAGTVAFRRFLLVAMGDGAAMSYDKSSGKHLGENLALKLNLSGADVINYYVEYEIRAA